VITPLPPMKAIGHRPTGLRVPCQRELAGDRFIECSRVKDIAAESPFRGHGRDRRIAGTLPGGTLPRESKSDQPSTTC